MPAINTSLASSLPLGSPTRSLNARLSPRTLLRHRQTASNASDASCKAWIADTLHQLHRSTVPRAALFSSGKQAEFCKICRTPLSTSPPNKGHSARATSTCRPLRRSIPCRSIAAELQTSAAGGGSGPPGGHSGNGGDGGGSNDPQNNTFASSEAPVPESFSAQGLQDIILFDVQGMVPLHAWMEHEQAAQASSHKTCQCCSCNAFLTCRHEMRRLCQQGEAYSGGAQMCHSGLVSPI